MPKILNPNSIAMILTLRYDPTRRPIRKPLTEKDIFPRYNRQTDIESNIIMLMQEELVKIHELYKFNRVTLSLSGGIDSRLTLAMLRKFLPTVKVTCVSVGFGDSDDEVSMAKEIARVYDCDFHELLLDNVLTDLPKLISVVREPRWNLYHYYTFEYGKHLSDHFFTGDGGDELFGGYTFRYHKFLTLCSRDSNWKDKVKAYLSCHERDWVPDQDKIFGEYVDFSWEKIYMHFRKYFQNELNPLDQVFLADFNGKLLFDWLPTNQAFAKHLGIQIWSLFLNDKMIKFAFEIPCSKKYDISTQMGKLPLRSLLTKQKEIINPVNDFTKKGFSVGLENLWNKNAHDIATKYLNVESEIIRYKAINPKWLVSTLSNLQDSRTGRNVRYISKILSILALEIWYRLFISEKMKSSEKL